jgi:oligopeptide transport system substrate-binding protein
MLRLALALGLSLILIAGEAAAETAKLLRRGSDAELESLDPHKGVSVYDIAVQKDLLEGLTILDMAKQPVPGVAASWDISADGRIYTFHLRPESRWSNGEPVIAGDFVYAMQRAVNPATGAADPSALTPITGAADILAGREKDPAKLGVTAVDDHTLRITLDRRTLNFPLKLTDPAALPLHRATLEKWGSEWPKPGHFVGNGAFLLKDWVPQAQITLVKNPLYRDAAAVTLDEVQYVVTDDQATAQKRWETGEIDTFDRPLSKNLPALRRDYPGELLSAPINAIRFLTINMTRPPLGSDLRLRQALAMSIDRDAIFRKISQRGDIPAYSMIPPVIAGYTQQPAEFSALTMPERLVQAKKLLADAGYGPDHPLHVTLIYPTQDDYRLWLGAVQQMWKQIGVDVTLDNMEWKVFLTTVQQKNYEVGILGETGSYDDPEDGLQNYLATNPIYNWPGYDSAAFGKLFSAALDAPDETARVASFEQAERQLMTDLPLIPLAFAVSDTLVHKRVIGWHAEVDFPLSRWLDVTAAPS